MSFRTKQAIAFAKSQPRIGKNTASNQTSLPHNKNGRNANKSLNSGNNGVKKRSQGFAQSTVGGGDSGGGSFGGNNYMRNGTTVLGSYSGPTQITGKRRGFNAKAYLSAQRQQQFSNNGPFGNSFATDQRNNAHQAGSTGVMGGRFGVQPSQFASGRKSKGFDIRGFKASVPKNSDLLVKTQHQEQLLEQQRKQTEQNQQVRKISVQKCSHQLHDELNSTLRFRSIDAEGGRLYQCIVCKASCTIYDNNDESDAQQIAKAFQQALVIQEESDAPTSLPWSDASATKSMTSISGTAKPSGARNYNAHRGKRNAKQYLKMLADMEKQSNESKQNQLTPQSKNNTNLVNDVADVAATAKPTTSADE